MAPVAGTETKPEGEKQAKAVDGSVNETLRKCPWSRQQRWS
jgi:hypothetical protein